MVHGLAPIALASAADTSSQTAAYSGEVRIV
jgi:hypothetical protein